MVTQRLMRRSCEGVLTSTDVKGNCPGSQHLNWSDKSEVSCRAYIPNLLLTAPRWRLKPAWLAGKEQRPSGSIRRLNAAMTRTLLSSRSVMRPTFSKPTLARTPPGAFSLAHELRPGPKGAEPMILIQGLGMQLTDWPPMFLDAFATRYHLILVDNRDSGLSAQFGPTFEFNADKRACDLFGPAPELARYTMFDMAADVVSTMNKLAVPAAHFLGFSMGGMIAQIIAADHPTRVLSLISLMSSGGEPWLDCTRFGSPRPDPFDDGF